MNADGLMILDGDGNSDVKEFSASCLNSAGSHRPLSRWDPLSRIVDKYTLILFDIPILNLKVPVIHRVYAGGGQS